MATVFSRVTSRSLLVLLALAGASACASDPNAPSSVTGTWVGTAAASQAAAAAWELTLTQSGSSITGFFAVTVAGSTSSASGPLTGSLQGSAFSAALVFGAACTRTMNGTLSGTTISGTITAGAGCANNPGPEPFTLTLE